jgi:polysaccharide export outer membrane protein
MTSLRLFVIALLLHISSSTVAQAPYRINPGDILLVFVWNEKDLTQEILVRPDGMISLPLAGQLMAGGLTPAEVEKNIADGLSKYLKDKPAVTVALKQTVGHKIYVLGKVNRPGEFPINRPTDIMQALALAGGLNAFAAENSITILRRDKEGKQTAIVFEYGEVKDGDDLETNILLESGDIVVVP